MRPSKKAIEEILNEMELKYGLRINVLSEIYEAEAQVVFMGRRRGITDKLRKIVFDAFERDEENENE